MTLMTWVPARAPSTSDGSTSDGIVASMTGGSDGRPYLAASWARSSASIPGATRIRPRSSEASSPAAVNRGSPASTRLTLATVPGVRMLPARQSRLGPIATGSASRVSARFGSMPATTTRAVSSSPPARTTPVARPSREVIATTSAPVRISTPAARRRRLEGGASAHPDRRVRRPSGPAAPPSLPAESASSTAVVPADQGPIAVYWTPRQAIAAWSASVSNDSATKSATAIGRTRVIVRPSCRPSPRKVRPSWSPARASPSPGDSMSGGVRAGQLAEEARRASGRAGRTRRTRPRRAPTVLAGPRPSGADVGPEHDRLAVRAGRERRARPGRRATGRGA